jgi:hypothetical protein
MNTLLHVETASENRSRVTCYADSVLYLPGQGSGSGGYTSRYSEPAAVYAMSIIGPEQTLRAIAAGCAFAQKHERTLLEFRGPSGKVVRAKWGWSWSCRATRLAGSTMHMVAMPELTVADDLSGKEVEHVIIPKGKDGQPATREDLEAAIYNRLLLCYSTPLLPLGIPGQPPAEAEAARAWCRLLVEQIITDSAAWKPLRLHPEQHDRTWEHAGVLRIRPEALDKLVSGMVARRLLKIPEAA